MKIDKTNFGWIFACCVLVILLGISVFLGLSGWFMSTDISYTTDLELGKIVQIDLDKNQSNCVSLSLDGSFLEGQHLPQIVSIKSIRSENEQYIRVKIFIYTSENETKRLDVENTVNWDYNEEDNYYYLNSLASPNDKISFCSHIILPDGLNLSTGKKYIVTILAESLDSEQNVIAIWGKNPLENV